jgi:hypothetical protein
MTPEDVRHLLAVWWAIGSSVYYFGRLAEVFRPHDRRANDDELLYIFTAEVVKAVYCTSKYAQRLSRANLDGRTVNCPSQDTLDTVENFLISIIFVGRRSQFLPNGNNELEH